AGPAYLLFHGVPEKVTLSSGLQVDDLWLVPVEDTGNLWISFPNHYRGGFQLTIGLKKGNVSLPKKCLVSVTVGDMTKQNGPTLSLLVPDNRTAETGASNTSLTKTDTQPP